MKNLHNLEFCTRLKNCAFQDFFGSSQSRKLSALTNKKLLGRHFTPHKFSPLNDGPNLSKEKRNKYHLFTVKLFHTCANEIWEVKLFFVLFLKQSYYTTSEDVKTTFKIEAKNIKTFHGLLLMVCKIAASTFFKTSPFMFYRRKSKLWQF